MIETSIKEWWQDGLEDKKVKSLIQVNILITEYYKKILQNKLYI